MSISSSKFFKLKLIALTLLGLASQSLDASDFTNPPKSYEERPGFLTHEHDHDKGSSGDISPFSAGAPQSAPTPTNAPPPAPTIPTPPPPLRPHS